MPVEVPQAVYLIWALTLAVVIFFVVPLAIFLLYRVLRMARSIERYFAEAAATGAGIAQNTGHIKALAETIEVATTILSVAGSINKRSETIKSTLAARTNRGNGHQR